MLTGHGIRLLLAALLIGLQLGCACTEMFTCREMPLDTNWGRSFETVRDKQMVHPDGSGDPARVVEGIEGQTAGSIMNQYRKSFEKTAPTPVYNVSFGTSGK